MQGRPDIQKTRARTLLNCFKRGSEPLSFPSLINFNAFSGTITADKKKKMILCTQGKRAAVWDCRLYFSEPVRSWIPLLPDHYLLSVAQPGPSLQYLQYHAGQLYNPTKEFRECDGFYLIYLSVLAQSYSSPHRANLSGPFLSLAAHGHLLDAHLFCREESWLSGLAWGGQTKGLSSLTEW